MSISLRNPTDVVTEQRLKDFYDGIYPYLGSAEYTAGDGINIDDENEISVDEMPSTDMGEIVSPLPSVMSRRFKYSTDEQVVGEWIDGKPIYQRTFTKNSQDLPSTGTWYWNLNLSIVGKLIDSSGYYTANFSESTKYSYKFGETSFNDEDTVNNLRTLVFQDGNNVKIKIRQNVSTSNTFNISDIFITIWYTKITD